MTIPKLSSGSSNELRAGYLTRKRIPSFTRNGHKVSNAQVQCLLPPQQRIVCHKVQVWISSSTSAVLTNAQVQCLLPPQKKGKRVVCHEVQVWISSSRNGKGEIFNIEECLKSRKKIYALPQGDLEVRVNDYNPLILLLTNASMDIQFIAESSLALAH